MDNNIKKLSIIVSVYNEEAVLTQFYDAFREISGRFEWDYELIFVNDGSTDRSLFLLRTFAEDDQKVKIISFSRNFGHEAAMIAGIDHAVGDGLICMDADLQHPLECIFPIVEKFNEGFDVINMVRLANKDAGFLKNITSDTFYGLINALSSQNFEVNASDFFALRYRAAQVLRTEYRERNRFLRGYVQSVGFRKTTLEYTAAPRAGGKSHYSMRKLMKFSFNIIVCFSEAPLKLGITAGLISGLATLILFVCTMCHLHSDSAALWAVMTLLCFLFSILYLLIGIIGEYLAVLLSETKGRPIYIVEEKINLESSERSTI